MFVDCVEQIHSSSTYLLNTYYVPSSRQHSERTHKQRNWKEERGESGGKEVTSEVTDAWELTNIWTPVGVKAVQSLRACLRPQVPHTRSQFAI